MIEKKRKTELDIDLTIQAPVVEAPPPPPPEPEPVAKPEPIPEPAEKKPSKRKLYIIAGVSSAVVLLTVITLTVYFGTKEKTVEPPVDKKVIEVTAPKQREATNKLNNLPLKPFLLPINQNGKKGFLRVKFSLLLSNMDAVVEVEENLSLMRETIYLFAKQHEPDDFKRSGKRDETIETLRRLLDRSLQNGRVKNIMITEFTLL